MKRNGTLSSLSALVDLREREVDGLTADMARKEVMRERFSSNLARMHKLCAGGSAQGSLPIALSVNRAGYKQALLQMADQHRQDLTLHEADMAVTQRALIAASRKCEALSQVRAQQQRRVRAEQVRREHKREDDLASQVWWRTRS